VACSLERTEVSVEVRRGAQVRERESVAKEQITDERLVELKQDIRKDLGDVTKRN
jgi:hypothetical protein